MDKVASKVAFVKANLPTPAWEVVAGSGGAKKGCSKLWETFPVVAKPIDQGSSVDLTIAHTPDELREAVDRICARYGRCMVEQFIGGRELTVGVLDGEAFQLPPIEIVVHGHEFYDYQAKYFDEATEYRMDPALPPGLREEMIRLAREAHASLGCRDFSRVDILLGEDNAPFILEINTIPGFTSHSLVPKAAAHVGLGFAALCDRLIGMAMARGPKEDAGTRRRRDAGTKKRGEGAKARRGAE
jgi:D-alanine-D-alanine ligase